MSIYFAINDELGLGVNSGVSYCILEETRKLFDEEYQICMDEIYEGYDVGMGVVTFSEVTDKCYNYFYKKCVIAMKNFPDSEHANGMRGSLVEAIINVWNDLLETLRKDPRYQAD